MSANCQAYAPSWTGQHARSASSCSIGRQSTRRATATAAPAGGILGRRDDTISTRPLCLVDQVRTSMVLTPLAIMLAHGCLIEIAFILVKPPAPRSSAVGADTCLQSTTSPIKWKFLPSGPHCADKVKGISVID